MNRFLIAPIILLAGLALSFGVATAEEDVDNPVARSVIDSQIKAFRGGSHEQAFGYAAPSLREMFGSTDNFIKMVKRGYGPIYGAQDWRFGRARSVSGTHFQEVLLTGPAGNNWVALYQLKQQADGSWKITSVQMKKASDLST